MIRTEEVYLERLQSEITHFLVFTNPSTQQHTSSPTAGANSGSYLLPSSATDTISSLSWSPTANHLCSTSWDGKIHIYEVSQTGHAYNQATANPKAEAINENSAPVLCSTFSSDGNTIYLGGGDNSVRMWQLGQQLNGAAPAKIGEHTMPVIAVCYYQRLNWVVSTSFDKQLSFWNPQQPMVKLGSIPMEDKAYAMDLRGDVLVVALANNTINVYSMAGQGPELKFNLRSELKFQIRSIKVLPDCTGFSVGGIEGRVSIFPFEEIKTNNNGKEVSNR